MFTTRSSRKHRLLFIARAGLFSVALLAACDTDEGVAPKPAQVPTSAQPALYPVRTGGLRMTVVDDAGTLISGDGIAFKVTDSQNNTVTVHDNWFQEDSDLKKGIVVRMGLAPGLYNVCQTAWAQGYLLGTETCVTANVAAGVVKDAGTFVNPRKPKVVFSATAVGTGKPLGGGVFTIKDSLGMGINVVADNGGADYDKADGKFLVYLPGQGKYRVCVHTFPAVGIVPVAQLPYCSAEFQVVYGQTFTVPPFVFNPQWSGTWAVSNGYQDANGYYLIGPSSFKVYNPAIQAWWDIDDNGWNDHDPTLGKIHMSFPNGGTFSVCEVTPPPNHWNAQPNCKTLNIVTSGLPASAGVFINPEKQVVYNP